MGIRQYTGDRLVDGCRDRVEREIRRFPFQNEPIRQEFWAMYEHSKALNAEIGKLKKQIAMRPPLKNLTPFCTQCGQHFISRDRGDGHPEKTYCEPCHNENLQH
jgi:hypothetical protein